MLIAGGAEMTPADQPLPPDTLLGLHPERPGPLRAGEFETWPQEPDRPMELIAGWVVPMSPGDFATGEVSADLAAILLPLVRGRGWRMSHDARHRLPRPADTVVFPDLAIHCAPEVEMVPGTRTVSRVPDLVIELLGEETAERDMAPRGAKFLAYQMSGVREYFYAWPDGRGASGFRREGDLLVPIEADEEGLFESRLLGARLRLAPARIAVTPPG
jgi:Uma2 family endonuclease